MTGLAKASLTLASKGILATPLGLSQCSFQIQMFVEFFWSCRYSVNDRSALFLLLERLLKSNQCVVYAVVLYPISIYQINQINEWHLCGRYFGYVSISGGNADNWQVLDGFGFRILDQPQHGFQLLRKIMISMLVYFPSRWLFFTEHWTAFRDD